MQALQGGGGPSAADVPLASAARRYSVAWELLLWLLSWMLLLLGMFLVACTSGVLFALTPLCIDKSTKQEARVDGRSEG